MRKVNLIAAIGTPLNAEETLHREGLERLLDLQWGAGINGVLVRHNGSAAATSSRANIRRLDQE